MGARSTRARSTRASLRDEVRPEAREVVDALRSWGVRRIVLLTGDHATAAAAVAESLAISEW